MGSSATVSLQDGKVELIQETKYPWDGKIQITVKPEKSFAFNLYLRVPGWCKQGHMLHVNGKPATAKAEVSHGYWKVSRTWQAGDTVTLDLPMPVERVYADPHVKADVGRVALMRGPVVYCLEGVDNNGQARNLCLPRDKKLTAHFEKDLLGGVVVVRGEALAISSKDDDRRTTKPVPFQAVPYSTWDNRGPGEMVVWLPETPERAELPGEDGVLSNGVRVRASHVFAGDTLTALNDGVLPKSSNDHDIPRMTWWDRKGSVEWASYRYPQALQLSTAAVYWFDDTGRGGCRVPAEWKLLWLDGKEWKPVKLTAGSTYGTALDQFNKVTFEPVTTRELRLEVKLKTGFSGGILEWQVK
jgi:hypothetical protein